MVDGYAADLCLDRLALFGLVAASDDALSRTFELELLMGYCIKALVFA